MAGPSPRHRPRPRPAGAPRAGAALGRCAHGQGAAGGACGPPRASSRALTQRPPGAAREPRVSGLGELGPLLRRRPRCRALSGFGRSRRRPAPGPAPGAPAAPPTPGGEGAGRLGRLRLRGERGDGQRRGRPPTSPSAVRPPARRPARGAFEPRSRPPAHPIGPLRGCVGGAGRTRGTPRRWYSPATRLPTPLRAVQVSAPGGRGLGQSLGYRALLKCRYGCGEGNGGKGRAGLSLKETRGNGRRAPSPACVPRAPSSAPNKQIPGSRRTAPLLPPADTGARRSERHDEQWDSDSGVAVPGGRAALCPLPCPRLLRPHLHSRSLPEHAEGLRFHSSPALWLLRLRPGGPGPRQTCLRARSVPSPLSQRGEGTGNLPPARSRVQSTAPPPTRPLVPGLRGRVRDSEEEITGGDGGRSPTGALTAGPGVADTPAETPSHPQPLQAPGVFPQPGSLSHYPRVPRSVFTARLLLAGPRGASLPRDPQ